MTVHQQRIYNVTNDAIQQHHQGLSEEETLEQIHSSSSSTACSFPDSSSYHNVNVMSIPYLWPEKSCCLQYKNLFLSWNFFLSIAHRVCHVWGRIRSPSHLPSYLSSPRTCPQISHKPRSLGSGPPCPNKGGKASFRKYPFEYTTQTNLALKIWSDKASWRWKWDVDTSERRRGRRREGKRRGKEERKWQQQCQRQSRQ